MNELERIAEDMAKKFIEPHAKRLGYVDGVRKGIEKSIVRMEQENPNHDEHISGIIVGLKMSSDMLRAALEDDLDSLARTAQAWKTGTPETADDCECGYCRGETG